MARTLHHGKHGQEAWVNRDGVSRDRDAPTGEQKAELARIARHAERNILRAIVAGKDADAVPHVVTRPTWA